MTLVGWERGLSFFRPSHDTIDPIRHVNTHVGGRALERWQLSCRLTSLLWHAEAALLLVVNAGSILSRDGVHGGHARGGRERWH